MKKTTILVVDDEPQTLKYVGANLKARGYEVMTASDGTEALKLAQENLIDLVLLDVNMPGPDGFEVARTIRKWSEVPIIMLTARGQEKDKVQALDIGADDYLTKPFGIEELLARVRVALRRISGSKSTTIPPIQFADVSIDFSAQRVIKAGQPVKLTQTEFSLLAYLARNANKVLTHRMLLNAVWGPEYGSERDYLWTYVRRLRRKLEPDPDHPKHLLTETGVGYRFQP